jgi:hypothetical protein
VPVLRISREIMISLYSHRGNHLRLFLSHSLSNCSALASFNYIHLPGLDLPREAGFLDLATVIRGFHQYLAQTGIDKTPFRWV